MAPSAQASNSPGTADGRRLIVGIDLGTSNCAVAYVDPAQGADAPVVDVPLGQFVRPGEFVGRAHLPSCIYLPRSGELPAEATRLPWEPPEAPAGLLVGEAAQWLGARVPGRLVASSKSWLCHADVDRQAAILPWGAPADVPRMSPVDAAATLLAHVRNAFQHALPGVDLADQEVVLTVPASFDEVARALTVSAARKAGLEKFTLIEEPQAAFYDFTSRHRRQLAETLTGVRLVLVVDVGGGTTDLTLVQVEVQPEGVAFRRLAVSDHLMLGGDNMDAALAHRVEERLRSEGTLSSRLTVEQWGSLLHATRAVKERLLAASSPERISVSIASASSRLVASTLASELSRSEAEELLVGGFFPKVGLESVPRAQARMAIQEMGLPYAQETAITRHVLAFLRTHATTARKALGGEEGSDTSLPRPDALLLNGGVFNSPRLATALVEGLSSWWPTKPTIPLLPHDSLDLAVARGAAYYGLARRGLGRKITGGAARAYYVRVEGGQSETKETGVCVIPRGFEEGNAVELADRAFSLSLGQPVQFQLYSTTSDRVDRSGDVIELDGTFHALPPIHTILKSTESAKSLPVHLVASLTEIGTLELACVATSSKERWRLEFDLRGAHSGRELAVTESMPLRFSEAIDQVQRVFGNKPLPLGSRDVKQLFKSLERVLGPRDNWRLPVLRELWSHLYAGAAKRRRSAEHERVLFQLLGFSLRPGFGYPLDEWRCEQTFTLFKDLVQHHGDKALWSEFWVLWRRISGGLGEDQQRAIFSYLAPWLEQRIPLATAKSKTRVRGIVPEGLDEMVRTAASLERLAPSDKERLGGWIAERLSAQPAAGGPWAWALGRLGARQLLRGSAHQVLSSEVAERWLELLLSAGIPRIDGAPFAVVQLARMTGDRARDISDTARTRALEALVSTRVPEAWLELVSTVRALSAAEERQALGDSLPSGLRLA